MSKFKDFDRDLYFGDFLFIDFEKIIVNRILLKIYDFYIKIILFISSF